MSAKGFERSNAARELDKASEEFFEEKLRKLKLTAAQITEQSLAELQASLDTVNEVIRHPASFATMKATMTASPTSVSSLLGVSSEAHVEIGILPILLERKALILERINSLRPTEQIKDFRQVVADKVEDPKIREQLLRVLDGQAAKEEKLSMKLEGEWTGPLAAMKEEIEILRKMQDVHRLDGRLKVVEQLTSRLESEKVNKFDAATITITILASIAGLTGAVIGIVKWITG